MIATQDPGRRVPWWLGCTAALAVSAACPLKAASPPPLLVPRSAGAVATDTALASRAGAELLSQGGNAVDAAVAAALALGVVAPAGSGLGGGGFLIYWSAAEQKARVLDFREVAPGRAHRDMYLVEGKVDPSLSQTGGLAVAVPGEPAGLAELSARHGRLGLRRAAAPAARLARQGFAAPALLARVAAMIGPKLPPGAPLAALLMPGGKPLTAGALVRRPELARTIERFGKEGARPFYEGDVARAIVQAVSAAGGILGAEDLRRYQVQWREPVEGAFRGHRVLTVPPPAGGLPALEALQFLDALPAPAPPAGSSAALHRMAEALKHAFADRARLLGDPAFAAVPVAGLLDPALARARAGAFSDSRIRPHQDYGERVVPKGGGEAAHDHGTSHVCVVDGEGNAVALTTTVNLGFGSRLVAGPTGILLNDQMDDFSAQPGVQNAFGLVGTEANAIAPGKRPVSSMTPVVVVKDGRAVLCAGGSGGPRILSGTVQVIVNVIEHGMDAQAAVSAPRLHEQWVPDAVLVEPEIPLDVVEGLRRRGHRIQPERPGVPAVQAIVVGAAELQAASDPRKGGAPAAGAPKRARPPRDGDRATGAAASRRGRKERSAPLVPAAAPR